MTVAARIERRDTLDRRSSHRRKLHLGSKSTQAADDVVIQDISTSGMLLATSAKFEPFEEIEVELPHAGRIKARIVWTTSELFGCQFLQPISKAAVSAALLRSPAPEPSVPAARSGTLPEKSRGAAQKLSFGVKMRAIIAVSALLWVLILAALWLVSRTF